MKEIRELVLRWIAGEITSDEGMIELAKIASKEEQQEVHLDAGDL